MTTRKYLANGPAARVVNGPKLYIDPVPPTSAEKGLVVRCPGRLTDGNRPGDVKVFHRLVAISGHTRSARGRMALAPPLRGHLIQGGHYAQLR